MMGTQTKSTRYKIQIFVFILDFVKQVTLANRLFSSRDKTKIITNRVKTGREMDSAPLVFFQHDWYTERALD
jgi:hypothetical protein